MLLRIISIFYLFPFFLNADSLTSQPTYAIVFHETYCEKYNNAIHRYIHSVGKKGYSAFYFCTDTVDIKELKKRINLNAEERNVNLSEIKGINIFGPVISTATIRNLKSRDRYFYPTTTLMLDNIELVLYRNTVIDIKTKPYKSPDITRWVSHMFASPNKIDKDISSVLDNFSNELAEQGSISTGENFKNKLQNDLSDSRTVKYYSFPDGEGTAIIGMASFPVLWTITGLSRMREGYSFWRRFQTVGDYFGSFALIGLMSGVEAYSINSYLYTQHYLPDGNQWKKVLLRKPLNIDGFIDMHGKHYNYF